MEITEIRVFPVEEEKLKAYASIVLDDCFIVNDLKVIAGKRGLFISMPSRRRKRGGYRDVAHPLNNETRNRIEGLVIAEYRRSLGETVPEIDAAGTAAPEVEVRSPSEHDGDDVLPVVAREPAARPQEAVLASAGPDEDRPSLEEVERRHLRDSFWSVS